MTFHARDVKQVLVEELAPEPSPRLREASRWLVRHGTNRRAVMVGLGLMRGNAELQDAPLIRVIGLLRAVDQLAAEVLAGIGGAELDLIWLAERSRSFTRIVAVEALAEHSDAQVREWVLSTPRDLLSGDLARKVAERQDLAAMLDRPEVADDLWDQAGNLLLAMTSTRNYQSEIGRYENALAVYQRWVTVASQRPATVPRAALLAMVAEDVRTGQAAPVAGELRHGLVAEILSVLTSPAWMKVLRRSAASAGDPVEARRAAWVVNQITRDDVPKTGFAVRIVVPDPVPAGFPQVEARIVIDGVPVVAAAFNKGPAESPELLVGSGRLQAASEPRQIRLAEAYCTEGCCGGLYVTIVRQGPEVVWKDWRLSATGTSSPDCLPPEVRFNAVEYDDEVARAEQDYSWEWPARTVARLVAGQLRADPAILGRWDCSPGWCTAWLQDYDSARLTFMYPATRVSFDEPSVQFGVVIDVADRDPQTLATHVIDSLRNADPKLSAEMIGGSKNGAEALGLVYRPPSRW